MKLADWLDALSHKLLHATDPTLGSVPIGMLAAFPLGVPNNNWLLCTGATFDAAVYPALAAYLGGNTLPDYKGKVLVMQDAGQVEFDTLGEAGGAKTHTLTTAEMPNHTHEGFSGASAITQSGNGLVGGSGNPPVVSAGQIATGTGGGGAHNNLQPYKVVNIAIRGK